MGQASSRLVLKLTALGSILSIFAVFSATPAGLRTIADLGIAPIHPVGGFAARGSEIAGRTPVLERVYSDVDTLPAAGVLADADPAVPYDPAYPGSRFAARILSAADAANLIYSSFLKPTLDDQRAIALARLPHARPDHIFITGPDGDVAVNAAVLAYAPTLAGIEAPFAAVMSGSGPSIVEVPDGLNSPRPRPDPELLLTWLEGRALGQFAPGLHAWVQNPLPATVFEVAEQKCLAEGIYFEARGELEAGQAAVAQVILNRVRNPAYPDTVCAVVYQNEWRRHRCQFSFACDGRPERIAEQQQWLTAQRIAREVTEGKIWIAEIGDSTHYYANYVRPGWARRMIRMDTIGAHLFYRTRFGGWS